MNLPRLTADQSLVSRPKAAAPGWPASPDGVWPAGAGSNGVTMMISYVSSSFKQDIINGDAENPCGSRVACWGTGKQKYGFICCDPGLCRQDASGKPICYDLSSSDKKTILSETGLPQDVINLIVQ